MILLVGGHIPASKTRQEEYEHCLWRNLENPHISKVCLFVEDDQYVKRTYEKILQSQKLRLVEHGKRVTYAAMFDFANREFAAGSKIILSNSDIYMDHTIGMMVNFNLSGIFVVLSRAFDVTGDNVVECNPQRWCDSQDTWMACTPITIKNCDYCLGVRGCDNRLIYEARMAGYRVINPVSVIKTYHVHMSLYRTYDSIPAVPGPYQHCLDFELK